MRDGTGRLETLSERLEDDGPPEDPRGRYARLRREIAAQRRCQVRGCVSRLPCPEHGWPADLVRFA